MKKPKNEELSLILGSTREGHSLLIPLTRENKATVFSKLQEAGVVPTEIISGNTTADADFRGLLKLIGAQENQKIQRAFWTYLAFAFESGKRH